MTAGAISAAAEDAPTLENVGAAPPEAPLGHGYHCVPLARCWWRGILVRSAASRDG